MVWQDFVLAGGSILFSIALVPSVLSKSKPAWSSSLLTGTVLVAFALVYSTLSLWFSFGTTLVTALIWYILLAQKIKEVR